MIAVRLGVVCLHVYGFSQSRGQSQSNRIMSFFGSFVSSHVFIYEYEFSKTAKQQYNFHDTLYSPSQMAKVSKVVTVTLSCGQLH